MSYNFIIFIVTPVYSQIIKIILQLLQYFLRVCLCVCVPVIAKLHSRVRALNPSNCGNTVPEVARSVFCRFARSAERVVYLLFRLARQRLVFFLFVSYFPLLSFTFGKFFTSLSARYRFVQTRERASQTESRFHR